MNGMKENNSGFSLIELVVTLAIVAIVAGAVLSFAVISSKTYQRQNKEVEMQYEAQLATNQLQELLIDAVVGVSYSETGKELGIYNKDVYYIIKWDSTKQQLLYSEYHRQPDDSWVQKPADVRMADYVKDFSVDLSDMDKNGSACLNIVFCKEKDYKVTQRVFLRNKVAVNKTVGEMY